MLGDSEGGVVVAKQRSDVTWLAKSVCAGRRPAVTGYQVRSWLLFAATWVPWGPWQPSPGRCLPCPYHNLARGFPYLLSCHEAKDSHDAHVWAEKTVYATNEHSLWPTISLSRKCATGLPSHVQSWMYETQARPIINRFHSRTFAGINEKLTTSFWWDGWNHRM